MKKTIPIQIGSNQKRNRVDLEKLIEERKKYFQERKRNKREETFLDAFLPFLKTGICVILFTFISIFLIFSLMDWSFRNLFI